MPYDEGGRPAVAFSFGEKMQPIARHGRPIGRNRRSGVADAGADAVDVDKVLAGDASAFTGIVRRWQGPLVNLAWRFCSDRARAEDLAQEAFLRAFRALARWRREAAFSTWLFALATNLFRSELRRLPAFAPAELPDDVHDPRATAEAFDEADRDRAVRRAVRTLPPKYREALILFYFHDMDVQAAARSLGVPEGTVKARLSRGRDILRSKLARLADASPARSPKP